MFAKLISTIHPVQSATFVQKLLQVKIKLFEVGVELSAINNTQLPLEMGIPNNRMSQWDRNLTIITDLLI